ncbi:Ger(x)C family spore germination protein [Pseudoneobacillus sp. C159]
MRRIIHRFSYLLTLLFLLTGCWDQREIEKRAYVYAVGMDTAEAENKFKITYLIINPEYGTLVTGGGSDEPPTEIISFETNDLMTARNLANAVISKEITYDLLRAIFVSEKLAKEEQFIRWMYDATKDREIRRDIYFAVTKESTSEFFENNKPKLDTRVQKYFEQIFQHGIENGMIPDSVLHQYFKITEMDADLFLAIYGTTQQEAYDDHNKEEDKILAGQFKIEGSTNKTQFIGSAVFKEGKMIGKLTAEETRLAVLLNDTLNMSDVLTTFPDPYNEKYRIAVRLVKKKSNSVSMDLKDHTGTINVTVPLYMEILSDHSMVNYGENPAKRKQLKRFLEKRLTQKLEDLIKKTQEEYRADPFAWSLLARKQFQTIPEFENFNWMKSYPNLQANVKVKIRFGEFGRQGELPKLKEVRD